MAVPIAHNFIYKCRTSGDTVRRAEGRRALRCKPLLQRLLRATLADAYRNPWGTRRTIPHPAQVSCSSPITTLGARRARSATPASPCPPAQWYRRWHLCPGAGVGSICTACSRGHTSPSFRVGDAGGTRTAVSATDSVAQSNGSLCKAPGRWALVPMSACADAWEKLFNQERHGRQAGKQAGREGGKEGGTEGGRELHLNSDE